MIVKKSIVSCDGLDKQITCTQRLELLDGEKLPETWLVLPESPLTGKPVQLCPRHHKRFLCWLQQLGRVTG